MWTLFGYHEKLQSLIPQQLTLVTVPKKATTTNAIFCLFTLKE